MGKIFLLFFILSYLFKYIYLEIRTNSPLYCLKGKTCELQIISEETFTEEQNCTLNENKTIIVLNQIYVMNIILLLLFFQ